MMEWNDNLIDLASERRKREWLKPDFSYQTIINRMSKIELLEEMVKYQEERPAQGAIPLPMMIRGQILFRALEMSAETEELRLLASSYRRHLEQEITSAQRIGPK